MALSTGTIIGYDTKFGIASVRRDDGGEGKISIAALYGPSFMSLHKGRDVRGIRIRMQCTEDGPKAQIVAAKEIETSATD